MIDIDQVSFQYDTDSPVPIPALRGISLTADRDRRLGIAGASGSGKTTLLQIMCGLLLPTTGTVRFDGQDLSRSNRARRQACLDAGLVFQFPERQLFEATALEDVAYGPRNLGLKAAEIRQRARRALRAVELDPDAFGPRSPLALSFGEMRRVALAGMLAMKPRMLLLDEPTAGLDGRGRGNLAGLLRSLHEGGTGIVVASHDAGFLAEVAQDLILLRDGRVHVQGSAVEILQSPAVLRQAGGAVPFCSALVSALAERGWRVEPESMDEAAVAAALARAAAGQGR
jgi:energy-coupling factor transport system ATP-binding protein